MDSNETLQAKCPKCSAKIRVRRIDNRIAKHKLPRPTSWARGKQSDCPMSGEELREGESTSAGVRLSGEIVDNFDNDGELIYG